VGNAHPTKLDLDPQLKGRTLVNGSYQELPVNTSTTGELAIDSQTLGLTLQLIDGELRFFDRSHKLLSHRETEQARQKAESARQQAESARQQAIARLLAMGLTIEQVAEALGFTVEEVRSYRSN
jgi:predicted transposase/invertase (TIGR01784 family)